MLQCTVKSTVLQVTRFWIDQVAKKIRRCQDDDDDDNSAATVHVERCAPSASAKMSNEAVIGGLQAVFLSILFHLLPSRTSELVHCQYDCTHANIIILALLCGYFVTSCIKSALFVDIDSVSALTLGP